MNATCPETPDLLDHMEGRADLNAHLVACEPCSAALSELRAALSVEGALVATRPLDADVALASVLEQARQNRFARWRTTGFFSAAAAITLALLLPGKLASTTTQPGPEGGTAGANATVSGVAVGVPVRTPVITDPRIRDMIAPSSGSATAPVCS